MTISYHEMRKIAPEKARELVRKVLQHQKGSVSHTASILGITRATVRRARDGTPEDLPRRPKTSPRRINFGLEKLIVKEAHNTSFRYRRLTGYLQKKYSLTFSEHTVRAILKRK